MISECSNRPIFRTRINITCDEIVVVETVERKTGSYKDLIYLCGVLYQHLDEQLHDI